ncbi:uncharacterized protein LOC119630397 [Bombyx mori]|uniref:Integrase catalytic domain-containing protein n=1 Tax=Bombyx mori TaxID=7091 RepID=A0A8R2M671_BOMMO|nr:uncharacterized protein LOC119630397 [Bombyx mori]
MLLIKDLKETFGKDLTEMKEQVQQHGDHISQRESRIAKIEVQEALGKDSTYEQLMEPLESRYGDAHLEHVFRAQLKERVQCVVMDYFTKWLEVFAIPHQEASTIADKLVQEVFCRFGVPLEIHSDQGRNFESQAFQETCRVLGIHKTRTTSYHPQSDGMVERFTQILEKYLAKVVENR